MRVLLSALPDAFKAEVVELKEAATPVATWDWHIGENRFVWSPTSVSSQAPR